MADSGGAPAEDARIWVGRVKPGREADHAAFLEWLRGAEAASIFRRRRLTEYALWEQDGTVTVTFRAPRTGDPRIMIDFLRYPGMWPEFWEFSRGGRLEDEPGQEAASGRLAVHWRRDAGRV